MKLQRIFTPALLTAILLLGGICTVPAGCVLQAFGDLAGRYAQIVSDLTAWVQIKADKITSAARWSSVAPADRQSYALLEMKGSLGNAEKTAADQLKAVGYQTANSHLALINDDVMNSTRTSLQEMGEGVGWMTARAEVDDALGKKCLDGVGKALSTGSPTVVQAFHEANYTAAEVLRDVKTLLEGNPNLPAGKLFTEKLSNVNGDQGAVAEVAFAARKRRGGATPVDIGADEGTGAFAGKKVDQQWSDHIYQVGVSSDTIKGKLADEMETLAPGIKQALDALQAEKAAGRMPQSARFKFGYTVQGEWEPDPAPGMYIDQLNTRLAALYAPAAPPQVFGVPDFELLSLADP